jgi:scyllo-inositol 2-dehydrogenase (NADP+)
MTIKVGLVGYGLAGAVFHAPLIDACDAFELAAVLTSRKAPNAVRTLDELLRRSELVVIASPNRTHFLIAKQALEAGKHVVVDKPMTVTVGEGEELIALAAECGRMLTVFHNRRWDGDFLTVRKILPRLGEVNLFEAHWDRFRPAIKPGWREVPDEGAGLLSDLGPHLVDQALQLFGMPDAVTADIEMQRSAAAVDDYFELALHYGARRVKLGASTMVADPRPRFALHGSAGSFIKHGLDTQEAALKAGVDPLTPGFGVDDRHGVLILPDGSRETVPTEPGNYLEFYKLVASAVLEGGPAPVDPADALDGLRIIDLARESSRSGRQLELPAAS